MNGIVSRCMRPALSCRGTQAVAKARPLTHLFERAIDMYQPSYRSQRMQRPVSLQNKEAFLFKLVPYQDLKSIEVFLKRGENLHLNTRVEEPKFDLGATPLAEAIDSYRSDVFRLLVDAGADLSLSFVYRGRSYTPLSFAKAKFNYLQAHRSDYDGTGLYCNCYGELQKIIDFIENR